MDCYNGTAVPTPIIAPCGGEYLSTKCVASEDAIPAIETVAGDLQDTINKNIAQALLYKETQIENINSILPKVEDDYINDSAASAGGIGIGQLYHTSGIIKIRLV